MGANGSVFKRVEKKYRLDGHSRATIESTVLAPMEGDDFGRSLVTSLYLDTPERSLIARSMEKPIYKEKLRLRTYGKSHSQALIKAFCAYPVLRDREAPLSKEAVVKRCEEACKTLGILPERVPVYFEIKKKYKGIVYKRRLVLSLPAALAFFRGFSFEDAIVFWPLYKDGIALSRPSTLEHQIALELAAVMERSMPLEPSMAISCYRKAWTADAREGSESSASPLRITFDDHLRYMDCQGKKMEWKDLIGPEETIMEIKCAGSYPKELASTLSAGRIFPSSFTKYGTAYEATTMKRAS